MLGGVATAGGMCWALLEKLEEILENILEDLGCSLVPSGIWQHQSFLGCAGKKWDLVLGKPGQDCTSPGIPTGDTGMLRGRNDTHGTSEWHRGNCPLLAWDWNCPLHGNGTGAGAGAQGTAGRTQTAPLGPPEPGEPPSLHPQLIHESLHPSRPQAELRPASPPSSASSCSRSHRNHRGSFLPLGILGLDPSVGVAVPKVPLALGSCSQPGCGDRACPCGDIPEMCWGHSFGGHPNAAVSLSGLGFWEFSVPRGFRRLKSQGSGIPAGISGEILPRISLTDPTTLCKCTGSLKMPVFSVSRSGGHGFILGYLGMV